MDVLPERRGGADEDEKELDEAAVEANGLLESDGEEDAGRLNGGGRPPPAGLGRMVPLGGGP